jgi:hypothetical protein
MGKRARRGQPVTVNHFHKIKKIHEPASSPSLSPRASPFTEQNPSAAGGGTVAGSGRCRHESGHRHRIWPPQSRIRRIRPAWRVRTAAPRRGLLRLVEHRQEGSRRHAFPSAHQEGPRRHTPPRAAPRQAPPPRARAPHAIESPCAVHEAALPRCCAPSHAMRQAPRAEPCGEGGGRREERGSREEWG